jgi:hypothetical protein
MKKTNEEFIKQVKQLTGNEYIFLEPYINNDTKILVKHNKCNNIYKVKPHDFLNGKRCPLCSEKTRRIKKRLNGKKTFEKLIKNKYKKITEYKDSRTKVKLQCNLCNHIFEIKPNDLQQGHGCPKCANNLKYTEKEFIEYINNNAPDYKIIGKYVNNKTKIDLLHIKCNNIYSIQPVYFKLNRRCPFCKRSKGEERIIKWLEEHNYQYSQYITFQDLFYKSKSHPLTFDIRILCEDPNDYILIEYDGEFHEKGFNGDIKSLQDQQIKDKLKNDYCKNHDNIDFYRINYKDFNNIENILEDILKKY